MQALIKVLFGAVIMIAAIWWVLQGSSQLINRPGLLDLETLLNGGLPVGVFLIGLFIVWLEMDELRIEKELRTEEKKKKK